MHNYLLATVLHLAFHAGPGLAHAAEEAPVPGVRPACSLRAAPDQQFVIRLPFEIVDGRIYVQARVNNRGPFRFAIDTGASGLGRADLRLVGALGLVKSGTSSTSDGVATATVETVRFDTLELGGVTKSGVDLIARDYAKNLSPQAAFDGIIARDFFADGLLILDYPRKTLSFSRSLSLPASDAQLLSYERPFRVPVTVAGLPMQANLDTGANISMVMPKSLYDKIASGPLLPAAPGRLTNTVIETQRSVLEGQVDIGGMSLSKVELHVAEKFPELLLGAHLLQKFAVLIDQRSKRIALCN